MPYRIEDFKAAGLYEERSGQLECFFENGNVIPNGELKVSNKIKQMLSSVGGTSNRGDYSRQDSAVITSLLMSGLSPADTMATFAASIRGRDAQQRKLGHFENYVQRTIEKSAAFIRENPPVETKFSINFASPRSKFDGQGLVVSMGHEIETEKTEWIWPGFIPAGKITILAGDPGMGKSTILGDIISRVSKGTFLPTGQRSVTGTSLIASAEDSAEDTIIPRLIACDANLRKVGVIREVREDAAEGESKYLSFPRDIELLRNTLVTTGARVLVIDPLTAFIEKGADSYKDQDMRRILHPIEAIAQETGCAIIIIAHLNKREDASTLYRVGGTIGFIAAARSVLAVTRTPEDVRVLFSLKANLSVRPTAMSYDIRQVRKTKTDRQTWKGESVINSSAIRWLGEVDFDPFKKPDATPDGTALREACEFLTQLLSSGQMDSEEIYTEAKQAGVSKTYVNKAKLNLGVTQQRRSGKWFWDLPVA